jgi:hypothetical protein
MGRLGRDASNDAAESEKNTVKINLRQDELSGTEWSEV